ncbi:ABC-type polysaccharide/polyol phosphate export permease [Peribacillus deserti]|uniref:ABC-type polysaccharide/polyol phosphate export permease n=1 Tax=Peribacillus deserti TaxID=673318 RepID=A0ABS2QD49_9BACI|nr:ABC transporter permease [Peribacillus deserti]MBM7690734.1 ABC-type polysaccharide/polyol phosphate export permease [Peribacillus deserti]
MFNIYKEMWDRRKMIHALSLQEIKKEYAGTVLGSVWGLVNPLMRIAVYWFVFSIGTRADNPVGGAPYAAWLAIGMVAWFLLNDAFRLSQKAFRSKRSIIKNTPFPIAILPAVQITFSFYTHLILLVVILIAMAFALQTVSVYWLQILYYDFAALMLLLGLGSVTAPLVAISKDFGRFLDTVLIFLFWMTPILWPVENAGPLENVVKLNPFHYIVQGYRDSIFYHSGFWEHPLYTLYFWALVLVLFILGNYLYKRMKPIFLDIM